MEVTVPKFIEREPKIIGPLTFKQFLYLLVPGVACFILYFTLGKRNFFQWVLIVILLMGGGVAVGFVKIRGRPVLIFFKNFFSFTVSSKVFIWRRKFLPPKIQKIKPVEKMEEETGLKVVARGSLHKLSTIVDTRKK
jgi:hypothetical protein